MASIGEILTEAEAEAVAVVVSQDSTVMYDDSILTEMKYLTIEEIYERLDQEFTKWTAPGSSTPLILLQNSGVILRHLSELYRRNIQWPSELEWWEYDKVRCMEKRVCGYSCIYSSESEQNYSSRARRTLEEHRVGKIFQPDEIRCGTKCTGCAIPGENRSTKEESIKFHEQQVSTRLWSILHKIKLFIKKELEKLRKIKSIQMALLKTPLVYDEINELMDTILDANGNKISMFKDYLAPEHYRLIRAGRDISEIKEQEELLRSLRNMKMKQRI